MVSAHFNKKNKKEEATGARHYKTELTQDMKREKIGEY